VVPYWGNLYVNSNRGIEMRLFQTENIYGNEIIIVFEEITMIEKGDDSATIYFKNGIDTEIPIEKYEEFTEFIRNNAKTW
jgi:hypothetical protein